MTGKRFNLIEVNGNIEDSCTQVVYDGGEDVFELLDCMNALNEECLQYLNIIGDIRVYAKENNVENILKIINELDVKLIED